MPGPLSLRERVRGGLSALRTPCRMVLGAAEFCRQRAPYNDENLVVALIELLVQKLRSIDKPGDY